VTKKKVLRAEAFALEADAVVGVRLDFNEYSGGGKSMLFVVATGTAVKLQPQENDTTEIIHAKKQI
jgi:uncharacterized protein YbjQ (UPF0145 family)